MISELISWGLMGWGLCMANFPFFTNRWLLIGPSKNAVHQNHFVWLIPELLFGFALFITAGWVGEMTLGQRHSQGWEFYVVMLCLFLTFAFPGFIWRFLRRA